MDDPTRPVLRIVRGDATPEELAALTAIVAASGGSSASDEDGPAPVRGRWNDPAHSMRRFWPSGPGGWRSAL
jgi:hypothetical protein